MKNMKNLNGFLVSVEAINASAKEVALRVASWYKGGATPLSYRDDPNSFGVVLSPVSDTEAEVFCYMAEDMTFAESFRKKVSTQLKKLGLTLVRMTGDEAASLWVDFAVAAH